MDEWRVIALILGLIILVSLFRSALNGFYRRIDYLSAQLTTTNTYLERIGGLVLVASADVRAMKSKLLQEEPQGNQWDMGELFSDDEKWQG